MNALWSVSNNLICVYGMCCEYPLNDSDAMYPTANNAHGIDWTIWLSRALRDQEKANKAIDVHLEHTSNKQQLKRIRSLYCDNIRKDTMNVTHIWQEKINQKSNQESAQQCRIEHKLIHAINFVCRSVAILLDTNLSHSKLHNIVVIVCHVSSR
eukprot:212396_1